jgi:hypothetical protein
MLKELIIYNQNQLEAMDGKIEIESELGHGSNFKIYLNENKLTYIIDDDKLTVKLMSILISKSKFCEEIIFYNAHWLLIH